MTTNNILLEKNKKAFFCSDQHFGSPNKEESREREKKFVTFLDNIKKGCSVLFLLGDLFDFWFEYKYVVPKNYIRVLGKLAEFVDSGIPVYFFTGNHDMWMFGYFENELGIKVFKKYQYFKINNKKFFIGHGDGLGPKDKGYKRLKKVFSNKLNQWAFSKLHPDFSFRIANFLSTRSKKITGVAEEKKYLGDENEWLLLYAKRKLEKDFFDYFIFGHRHFPIEKNIDNKSKYINTGDWVYDFTYGEYDGKKFFLKKYE